MQTNAPGFDRIKLSVKPVSYRQTNAAGGGNNPARARTAANEPSVKALEVCTGSKLKPEPGPYPRLSDPTRPDPTRAARLNLEPEPDPRTPPPPPPTNSQQKKRKKAAFHDCMQRNRLVKALPFHKHLPVMKVCEHQVQRSHTFCRVYEFCMGKTIILPPCKLWSFFVS